MDGILCMIMYNGTLANEKLQVGEDLDRFSSHLTNAY